MGLQRAGCGSSPRTWGTRPRTDSGSRPRRFIPTHVGNTRPHARCRRARTVHPHARGEHLASSNTMRAWSGSSPRTWGTHRRAPRAPVRVRFIPTHVGNTAALTRFRTADQVHPHARGEHLTPIQSLRSSVGSSPRTWGTRHVEHAGNVGLRFIPTHVGNTPSCASCRPRRTVHPHARGEHFLLPSYSSPLNGSSPRTWGTHRRLQVREQQHRFIPTHVGNTSTLAFLRLLSSVHPHARGEHATGGNRGQGNPGSSPRTWGTRKTAWARPAAAWFIPTHVGNTRIGSIPHLKVTVHPHARGEHVGLLPG